MIKSFPTNKSLGLDGSSGECYQIFREELTSILLRLLQRIAEEHSQTHVMRPPSSWCHKQTKIPHTKKDRPISLMNTNAKICNKIQANQIQQYIKMIIHHDQVGFIPGIQKFFNNHQAISVIYYINKWGIKTVWSYQQM